MPMSKKDFEGVARAFNNVPTEYKDKGWTMAVASVASYSLGVNPRFAAKKFFEACGMTDEQMAFSSAMYNIQGVLP